jgi:enoyl-[acyl-carrier-protein] reductase (NADH)
MDLLKKYVPSVFGKCESIEEVIKILTLHTALKRGQKPEDIAYSVMFLASDIASEITGQALIVDSGGLRR